MKSMENYIAKILKEDFGSNYKDVYEKSELIQYLNFKSKAIHGNVKSRRSLANWYALYSILTFYKENNFIGNKESYLHFEGFPYTPLLEFQRKQYGGEKLQNHALNSRVNGEFINKIATNKTKNLIVINQGKYLIHPDYLYIKTGNKETDITPTVLKIIKEYQNLLYKKDNSFAEALAEIKSLTNYNKQREKLKNLLNTDTEARVFEIMSYAILERHFEKVTIYIGFSMEELHKKTLQLYKTGRTNANDGGIDFVMKPLGRFFQVTEVDNYDKYFLDIEKVNHYPITFVVKTFKSSDEMRSELLQYGTEKSGGLDILKDKYHKAIEEVITINELIAWLDELSNQDIEYLIEEIDRYFKLEMNITEVN